MITLWKKNRLAVLPSLGQAALFALLFTNDRFTKRSFETVTPFPLHHTSHCGISIVMGAHNNRVLDTGLRSNDNSASLLSCTSTFNRAVLISDIILVCFVAFTFNIMTPICPGHRTKPKPPPLLLRKTSSLPQHTPTESTPTPRTLQQSSSTKP